MLILSFIPAKYLLFEIKIPNRILASSSALAQLLASENGITWAKSPFLWINGIFSDKVRKFELHDYVNIIIDSRFSGSKRVLHPMVQTCLKVRRVPLLSRYLVRKCSRIPISAIWVRTGCTKYKSFDSIQGQGEL